MNLTWQRKVPGIAWLLALVVGCFSQNSRAQPFVEISTGLPGVSDGSVAWGDYDNDGDPDLLLAGNSAGGPLTRIYRNDGGAFVDLNAGLPGISEGGVAWADYDGDGHLDFGLTGAGTAAVFSQIYRNNGNGAFANINAPLPPLEGSTLAWGDYDNDGDLDLFLAGYTGSAYAGAVYRNDGNHTFTDSGITTIRGGAAGSAAWSDFDNDGDHDLLFAAFTGDTTSGQSSRLYRNHNGAFTNITSLSLTAMSYSSVAWGDYDNDGDLDLLLAGSSISGVQSFPTLRLYRNNTNGASITAISSGMTGAQNCSLAWGDYDNDGDLDVALAGYNTSFAAHSRIYLNLGSGLFLDTGTSLTPVIDAALAWVDYDGDGDLDLLLTGNDGAVAVTKLYRNDNVFANSVPFPPSGLGYSVAGKTATLHWNAGSDAIQPGGFTYNLRVGTSPGADNIVASMANSGTGHRRVPRLGNSSERLSWTLKLPIGGYYWSVQTIDHAFAGSGFAAEQYFEIPPQAPDVLTLAATNIGLNSATVRATVNPNGAATSIYFQYGTTTNYGGVSSAINVGSGENLESVAELLTNLLPATAYQFRVVAGNNYGTNFGANLSFVTPIFLEVTNVSLVGVGNGAIAWGDYDRDGFTDLLVAGGNATGTITRVYRNLSGTNFVEAVTNLPGMNNGTVAWGDYDRDGDLDLAMTGNGASRIYRHDGAGGFTDIAAGLPMLGNGASAQWVDFDNDGDLDLTMSAGGNNTGRLCRNDGNDQFPSVPNVLPQVYDSAQAWADYDNDGDQDLLLSGYNYGVGGVSELTRLYRNDGRGNLTNSTLSFQPVYRGATSWGDYDNDGDLDFLMCGVQFSTRYTLLYSNRNNGTFATVTISGVPRVDQGNVSWGDYDNDGDLDFLVVGQTSTGVAARVYRNDANVFRDSGAVLPAFGNIRAEWGDYNNDGRLDLLVMGYSGSNYVTKLFRNLSPGPNPTPTTPVALNTSVANNAVTLGWSAATDPNQSGGLTYNLRMGTAPGLSDVLSPMANEATGFRRLPKLGNANLRQSATLTNLVVGDYYWSVQAVDHTYAGSPFSTNASFTITAALLPPVVITGTVTNISLHTATVAGSANARGSPTTAYFQYGVTTNFGSVAEGQSIGSSITNVAVTAVLTNLADGTTYYYRVGASNLNGTVFGNTFSFTTEAQFSNVVTALPFLGSGSYSWAGNAVWGDFDNDNDLDVALTGEALSTTQVFRNDGNAVFSAAVNNLPVGGYGNLDWGDYDQDGDLDLLIAGSPSLAVARNDGGAQFTVVTTNTDGLFGAEFGVWVDYDGDGDLDICTYDHVAQNLYYAQSRLYRNDGGQFVPSGVPMPKFSAGQMDWGDYDGDGDPDLAMSGLFIITNYAVPATRIYRNDGHGDFTDIQASLAGFENARIAWGDYDNDGDLDLLATGQNNSGGQTILYRNDAGNFVAAAAGLPPSIGRGPAGWTDYENDGQLDLYLNFEDYYYSTNRIYRNAGNGTFSDSGKHFVGSTAWYVRISSVAWGDYDRDGDLDALVGNRLNRNNNLVPDAVPDAPAGLSAVRTGNVVTLTWNVPTDANQSGGSIGTTFRLAPRPERSTSSRRPLPLTACDVWQGAGSLHMPSGNWTCPSARTTGGSRPLITHWPGRPFPVRPASKCQRRRRPC